VSSRPIATGKSSQETNLNGQNRWLFYAFPTNLQNQNCHPKRDDTRKYRDYNFARSRNFRRLTRTCDSQINILC